MQVFKQTKDLRNHLQSARLEGRSIGLVPTMGALHAGHMSLIASCIQKVDICVCSIFVNPTQFNNKDDFRKYPRNGEFDLDLLKNAGCDIVFAPSEDEVYPRKPRVAFESGVVGDVLEGEFRPGHFNGVLLVVSKLFNIVQPDLAFFGQKDLQQLILIRQMVEDLCFPVEVVSVPTEREKSGLAMSSRNIRLTPEQHEEAACLYKGLELGKSSLLEGKGFSEVRGIVENYIRKFASAKLEYFELLSLRDFAPVEKVSTGNDYAIAIAAYFGEVRLIDNVIFKK